MAGLLLWGIFWARGKAADEVCQRVEVTIDNADSTQFVTPQGVISEDGDQSYYVNRFGKHMSATASYHADVPVVQGHFTLQYPATRLLPMIEYVEADSLLSSLVTMYTMRDSNNIFITPAIHGHVVNMGDCDNFEAKFRKLKLFYRKVMPAKGWENYDTISVKWNYQVVATRRQKAVKIEMTYDSAYDEPEPDLQTITVAEDRHTLAIDDKKQESSSKKQDSSGKKQDSR